MYKGRATHSSGGSVEIKEQGWKPEKEMSNVPAKTMPLAKVAGITEHVTLTSLDRVLHTSNTGKVHCAGDEDRKLPLCHED